MEKNLVFEKLKHFFNDALGFVAIWGKKLKSDPHLKFYFI